MKIHIVQKGDTLWELSKKYGVDFEELKNLNSHLASPDMIMPGMKIKIPSHAKTVKKETMKVEKKKEVQKGYKDISPKPMPVVKEDDVKEKKEIIPEMPMPQVPQMPIQALPKLPSIDFDVQQYTVNLPPMPSYPQKKGEKIKEKPVKEAPQPQPKPKPQPTVPQQPQAQPMPMPMPVEQPMYHTIPCYYVNPCAPCYPFMMPLMMPFEGCHGAFHSPVNDCGCGGTGMSYPMMPESFAGYQQAIPNQGYSYNPMVQSEQMMSQPSQMGYPTPPTFPNLSAYREEEEDVGKEEE